MCGWVEVWICAYISEHVGCMYRQQMKPIYILDMPVLNKEIHRHSALLEAMAPNWLTGLL